MFDQFSNWPAKLQTVTQTTLKLKLKLFNQIMSSPSNGNSGDSVQKDYAFFKAWLAKINEKSTYSQNSSIMDRTKYNTIIAALIREENGENHQ